jgi:uncharacterized SAM-binding protein YcdF (DUF218 family)
VTFGGTTGRNLLLLIAFVATLVVLGCWDNRRQIEHVLARGYATTADITGAQFQRNMPLTADGWRPRFVEQDLSVDLKWLGRDGKTHEYKKVPVTEAFAGKIISGDQVRLIPVQVKLLDDELSVPVITADTTARLISLQTWTTISGYVALAAWAGFAGLSVLRWRRGDSAQASASSPIDIPPRRTFLGLAMLFGGGLMAFYAWSDARLADTIVAGGIDTTAEIIGVAARPGEGGRTSYTVRLSWKDGQGAIRHFGPTHISEAFWKKITRDGELAVRQTAMRYREDDPQARPVIVDDAPEQKWQTQFGIVAGLIMMVVGAACLFSAARHMRRR